MIEATDRTPIDLPGNPLDTLLDSPLGSQGGGQVFLVGAGPGDVQHLTLGAYQCLKTAQVLVYDALADDRLQELIPADCVRVNVGKRGGQPSPSQEEINQILVNYCRQGRRVVRLKGGDPFVFGRTTAEIQALIAAHCPFEVVPGLSSALAAPLLLGIPLTDPVLSRGFGVFTAHEPDALNWEVLSQLPTLVLLMGGHQLGEITGQLLRHERSPQTPIAIIRWASQPHQEIWEGTLLDIGQRVGRSPLSPCVMVVGEVVRLRHYLQSPLGSAPGSDPLALDPGHQADVGSPPPPPASY